VVREFAVKKLKKVFKPKQKAVAGDFMGFYLVNSWQRAVFCSNLGVEITPFINAFVESHQPE